MKNIAKINSTVRTWNRKAKRGSASEVETMVSWLGVIAPEYDKVGSRRGAVMPGIATVREGKRDGGYSMRNTRGRKRDNVANVGDSNVKSKIDISFKS